MPALSYISVLQIWLGWGMGGGGSTGVTLGDGGARGLRREEAESKLGWVRGGSLERILLAISRPPAPPRPAIEGDG